MSLPIYIVDAFTDKPFAGNPAGVCLVNQMDLSDETLTKIAAEMNLSETAFVRLLNDKDSYAKSRKFGLRWFTPKTEVPLCGHATLASASIIFSCLGNEVGDIQFDTLSGPLFAKHSDVGITLDMPLNRPEEVKDSEFTDVIKAILGDHVTPSDVRYSPSTKKLLLRLPDSLTETDLQRIVPGVDKLPDLTTSSKVRGVIVTLKGSGWGAYDFYSRYFAPWVGINEDPVTGSAHTVLGPYWSEVLGKNNLRGPGPAYRLKTSLGTKEHCLTKRQAPSYTMGHKYHERQEERPGQVYWYDPKLTAQGKVHSPAYVISGRPREKKPASEITPGPGDYDLVNIKEGVLSQDHRAPHVSIGQRPKWSSKSEAPPPNSYNIRVGLGARSQTEPYAPAWSIGGRSEVGGSHYQGTKEAVPGPANYAAVKPSVYKSTHGGYTIQGRTAAKDYVTVKDNPGPNAYDPYGAVPPKKGFTMGIRHSEYTMPLISAVDIL